MPLYQVAPTLAQQRESASAAVFMPTGAIAETGSRFMMGNQNIAPTTGKLFLTAIYLQAGMIVTNISMYCTVASISQTHRWYSLHDSGRLALKQTADQTTTVTTLNTLHTYALTGGAYTVLTTALYYVGVMASSTGTQPSWAGAGPIGNTNIAGLAPILWGNTSDTGLTTTAPNAGAITSTTTGAYAYLS